MRSQPHRHRYRNRRLRKRRRPHGPGPFGPQRLQAEARFADVLEKALGNIYRHVLPKLKDDLEAAGVRAKAAHLRHRALVQRLDTKAIADDEVFWFQQRSDFFDTLKDEQEALLKQGVTQASTLGMKVDFALVNQEVLQFAQIYNDEWWNQLSQTTRNSMRTAMQANIASGAGSRALAKDIAPLFGRQRAEMIASTETTRLYAEGNMIAYRADSTVEAVEWMTTGDDRVCEICGPLDGEQWEKRTSHEYPPAHPRCRCWLAPIVAGDAIERPPETMEPEAKDIRAEAKKREKAVTKEMRTLVKGRGKMDGLKYRVKGQGSLTRKMDDMVRAGKPRAEVAGSINDALRYTMVFEDANYAKNAQAILSELRAKGYSTKVSNYWSSVARKKAGGYQGINVVVTSPTGQRFELQFHTKLSLELKEKAHPIYQHLRKEAGQAGAPGASVRETLEGRMASIYDDVPIPQGATRLPSTPTKPQVLGVPDYPPLEPTHVVPLDPIKMADDVAENMLKTRSSYLEAVNNIVKTRRPLAAPYSTGPLSDQGARQVLKERVMKNIATKTGIPEESVRDWVSSWAASSSDSNPRSLMLQKATENRFGIKMNPWMQSQFENTMGSNPSYWVPRTKQLMAEADLIVDAMYMETQEWLAANGVERLTLMRGMEGVPEAVVKGVTTEGGFVEFHANPLSSWSIDPATAADFSGRRFIPKAGTRSVMSVVDVAADQVVAMPLSGAGCANEWEFIVLGGRQRVFMVDLTSTHALAPYSTINYSPWYDELMNALREALLDLTGRPIPEKWGL